MTAVINNTDLLNIYSMLKPKTQAFRLKVMLNKLEAVSNKVVSRCIATFKIGTSSPTQTAKIQSSKPPPNSGKTQPYSTAKSSSTTSPSTSTKLRDCTRTNKVYWCFRSKRKVLK